MSLESKFTRKTKSAVSILSLASLLTGCHLLLPLSARPVDSQVADATAERDSNSPDVDYLDQLNDYFTPETPLYDLNLPDIINDLQSPDSNYDQTLPDSQQNDDSGIFSKCTNGWSCTPQAGSCSASCLTSVKPLAIDCTKTITAYACTCWDGVYLKPSTQTGTNCNPCLEAALDCGN